MLTVVRSDVDAVVATQVTADELFALEDDGYRYDLLAGNLIRVSPAGFRHGRLAAEIVYRLRRGRGSAGAAAFARGTKRVPGIRARSGCRDRLTQRSLDDG